MTALARLAAYAAALAIIAAVAAGLGYAVGPLGEPDEATHSDPVHQDTDPVDDHTEKGDMTSDQNGHNRETEAASGLAVASSGYQLVLEDAALPTGRPGPFRFRIVGRDGEAVREFDLEGGVRMHLIVVRRDLTRYQHLHPELRPDGTWETELALPEAGVYRAFADFERAGDKTVLGADLFATGEFVPAPLPPPDTALEVDGYDVRLEGEAHASRETELVFSVRHGGEPVELEPYLGAQGHLVALRAGDLAYLHVHPLRDADRGEIAFAASFPTPGPYRLFLQVKDGGRVQTAAFTLKVRR